jgi:crossover junction endodeoxyribonuclease RuvC
MIKVLGIDPGLAATGVGLVWGLGRRVEGFAYGAISTPQRWGMGRRLETIHDRINRLLQEESPDVMVVEAVFSLDKYPQSGITLGKVCGVILLAGQRAGLSVAEVPVREAKQVLTGNGAASKIQLERAVRHELRCPQPIRPFHAADALGLALIGLYRNGAPGGPVSTR